MADCLYGANNALLSDLFVRKIPFVLAMRGQAGFWAPAAALHTAAEAARALRWRGPRRPGAWKKIVRHFRDGHEEVWWAGELRFAGFRLEGPRRAVAVTTDPARLPEFSTWYVVTNLPALGCTWDERRPFAPAALEEIVRLYGLRVWVEESYKQVKNELGWADFMVRSDAAIRRHWQLVLCAFSFCWRAYLPRRDAAPRKPTGASGAGEENPPGAPWSGRGENRQPTPLPLMAASITTRAELAHALATAPALVVRLVDRAPAEATSDAP